MSAYTFTVLDVFSEPYAAAPQLTAARTQAAGDNGPHNNLQGNRRPAAPRHLLGVDRAQTLQSMKVPPKNNKR